MPKDKSKEIEVSQIKDEPEEVEIRTVKTEPTDEQEPGDNNNTVPTLTALLNQPSIATDRPLNGKESYMKLLNLKLAEIAPVPLDVVRVKLDLDGDLSFELSIDEGSNGEKEGENEGEVEEPDAGQTENSSKVDTDTSGSAKRKKNTPVSEPGADKTIEILKLAQDKLRKSDKGEHDVSIQVREEPKSKSKSIFLKDKDDQYDESDTRKYTCLRCGFVTAADDELRSHMLQSHENELGVEAPRHIRKKMGTKYYPCDKCDQVFPTPRLLQYHRTQHAKVKVFTCGKCDQAFANFDILQKHQFEDQGGCLNAYRSTSGAAEPEPKSDKDKQAVERAFHPTLSNENLKSLNEKGENTFICQYFLSCGFKTKEQEQLVEHMKTTHSGSGDQPFSCEVCGYKDYQYGNFVAHQKQHHGPGVTTKVVCKTVWIPPEATQDQLKVEADDLSLSSDSSSVEPPPPPPPTKAKKSVSDNLSDASSLAPPPAKIKKSLNVEKLLSCDQCDYATNKLYQLTRHQRTHTGERPYSCLRCDSLTFKAADGLRRHMKKHEEEDEFLKAKLLLAAASGETVPVLEIEETDPLSGPPVPIPQECQALLDAGKIPESGKVSSAVSSSEEQSLDSGMSFPCEDCKAVFPTYISLKNHGIVKHGVKLQFSCTKCKYKTKEELLLKRHYLKRHATSAIPQKPIRKVASSLVRMVSASPGNKVACDSTTLDVDELKT